MKDRKNILPLKVILELRKIPDLVTGSDKLCPEASSLLNILKELSGFSPDNLSTRLGDLIQTFAEIGLNAPESARVLSKHIYLLASAEQKPLAFLSEAREALCSFSLENGKEKLIESLIKAPPEHLKDFLCAKSENEAISVPPPLVETQKLATPAQIKNGNSGALRPSKRAQHPINVELLEQKIHAGYRMLSKIPECAHLTLEQYAARIKANTILRENSSDKNVQSIIKMIQMHRDNLFKLLKNTDNPIDSIMGVLGNTGSLEMLQKRETLAKLERQHGAEPAFISHFVLGKSSEINARIADLSLEKPQCPEFIPDHVIERVPVYFAHKVMREMPGTSLDEAMRLAAEIKKMKTVKKVKLIPIIHWFWRELIKMDGEKITILDVIQSAAKNQAPTERVLGLFQSLRDAHAKGLIAQSDKETPFVAELLRLMPKIQCRSPETIKEMLSQAESKHRAGWKPQTLLAMFHGYDSSKTITRQKQSLPAPSFQNG